MSCNCRRDPNTKVCPAWRVIRRDSIRAQHRDGMRLREIATLWDMRYVGSVINQLGDTYDHGFAPVQSGKVVIAERHGDVKVFQPIIRCKDSGFNLNLVYDALRTGEPYAGYVWRRG